MLSTRELPNGSIEGAIVSRVAICATVVDHPLIVPRGMCPVGGRM